MSDGLKFDMNAFNAAIKDISRLNGRNGNYYVRTNARRMIKKLAWNCPISPRRFRGQGRARAGFWPAATALKITNIYTRFKLKGYKEGSFLDNTLKTGQKNPSFTIINSVPYILSMTHHSNQWVETAKNGVQAQMSADLIKYARDSWERRNLIDDLSAN